MTEERHWINLNGEKIALVLHYPPQGPWSCVVASHGLGASKDSEKYLLLSREFSRAGFAFCRFDFRGCGESQGDYAETTIEGRIKDLQSVIRFLNGHRAMAGGVSLLGSSLGGFIALYCAALEPEVRCVVTWNTPATLRGLRRELGGDLAGLGSAFFDELARETFADAPKGVSRCLVIQGDQDEVVPPEHGEFLWKCAAEPKRLHMLRGADHRLTNEEHRREAVWESLNWIKQYYGAEQ